METKNKDAISFKLNFRLIKWLQFIYKTKYLVGGHILHQGPILYCHGHLQASEITLNINKKGSYKPNKYDKV